LITVREPRSQLDDPRSHSPEGLSILAECERIKLLCTWRGRRTAERDHHAGGRERRVCRQTRSAAWRSTTPTDPPRGAEPGEAKRNTSWALRSTRPGGQSHAAHRAGAQQRTGQRRVGWNRTAGWRNGQRKVKPNHGREKTATTYEGTKTRGRRPAAFSRQVPLRAASRLTSRAAPRGGPDGVDRHTTRERGAQKGGWGASNVRRPERSGSAHAKKGAERGSESNDRRQTPPVEGRSL